jgi:uncharacterized tellurite resistance protein B-like protein
MTSTDESAFLAALEQIRTFSEQWLAGAKQAGNEAVDLYEQGAERALDLQAQLAEQAKPEWVAAMIKAHSQLARQATEDSVAATRKLLG